MVQFGYWFMLQPVPTSCLNSKMCWLMVQSAYWLNIFWSKSRNYEADLTILVFSCRELSLYQPNTHLSAHSFLPTISYFSSDLGETDTAVGTPTLEINN